LRIIALALLAATACTNGGGSGPDDTDVDQERPEGEMFCGYLALPTFTFDYYDTQTPQTCFLLRFFDDAGNQVDETHEGPTDVAFYMSLPHQTTFDRATGGDCLFTGTDADGATNGWSVAFDGASGVCQLPTFEVSGGPTARQFHTGAGTLSLDPATGWWLSTGNLGFVDYNYTDAMPLQGTAVVQSASWSITGESREADFGWPVTRFGGECDVQGSYATSNWTAEQLNANPLPQCSAFADPAAIGTPTYAFTLGGHGIPWSDGSTKKLAKLHQQCIFGGQTDTNWTTAVDFDAGDIAVSYRGNYIADDNRPYWCEVSFHGDIATEAR